MRPLSFLVALLVVAGCDTLMDGPETVVTRQLGVFLPSETAPLTVPDTVMVEESFRVIVTTFGGACESAPGDVEVEREGLAVTLRPYDVSLVPVGGACIFPQREFPRTVVVRFYEPGPAVVRAVGRDGFGADTGELEVERTVVVVPRAER